jgi:hypothetical protein
MGGKLLAGPQLSGYDCRADGVGDGYENWPLADIDPTNPAIRTSGGFYSCRQAIQSI